MPAGQAVRPLAASVLDPPAGRTQAALAGVASRRARARSPGGAVYGRRKLFHDPADEQPFTRDMHGVKVPAGVRSVVVEARDLKHGYSGKTVVVDLPGR